MWVPLPFPHSSRSKPFHHLSPQSDLCSPALSCDQAPYLHAVQRGFQKWMLYTKTPIHYGDTGQAKTHTMRVIFDPIVFHDFYTNLQIFYFMLPTCIMALSPKCNISMKIRNLNSPLINLNTQQLYIFEHLFPN